VTGVLLRANDKLTTDPNIAVADPYGEGWIAEMQPSDWETEKAALVTGAAGIAAYQAKLEADGVTCS
jgi:glycine cleavage system H protein